MDWLERNYYRDRPYEYGFTQMGIIDILSIT